MSLSLSTRSRATHDTAGQSLKPRVVVTNSWTCRRASQTRLPRAEDSVRHQKLGFLELKTPSGIRDSAS
ncbi:hypothetical protein RRG08_001656 [Elysia crispata]|uniref:Uncharacterized protein n=1 Tax=Elysia crispata TaxID=231223 RepID=A0AAE1ALD1_9GAST|nr:hypothetical protein RRG08_001656 [Elysia crispata]